MRLGAGLSRAWLAAGLGLAIAIATPSWAGPVQPAHKAHKTHLHHRHGSRGGELLVLANCYGRFIAWRDELAGLMLRANADTPLPEDRARFDRMEQAFAAGARHDRKLTLILQPTFREADFPTDIRKAFRSGLETASGAFADGGYRHVQILAVGQPDLSPAQRMARLKTNADQAFAPLAASCERTNRPEAR